MLGQVDSTHPTAADQFFDSIVPDSLRDLFPTGSHLLPENQSGRIEAGRLGADRFESGVIKSSRLVPMDARTFPLASFAFGGWLVGFRLLAHQLVPVGLCGLIIDRATLSSFESKVVDYPPTSKWLTGIRTRGTQKRGRSFPFFPVGLSIIAPGRRGSGQRRSAPEPAAVSRPPWRGTTKPRSPPSRRRRF